MHRLRNTYIIFTSDNGFFFGEHRLIGGKFLAYEPATHLPLPDPRPGHQAGHPDRRAGRATSTSRRPILELAGAEADKSIDGRSLVPFLHDPEPAHPAAAPLRVLRRDQRRRSSRAAIADPRATRRRGRSGAPPARPRATARDRLDRWRRPRTTRESASAPTSTSPGRTARRSSTTSTGTPTSSTTSSEIPNFFPIRNFLHRELLPARGLRRPRPASEAAPKFPLTRKELAATRKRGKRERRTRRTQRERTAKNGNRNANSSSHSTRHERRRRSRPLGARYSMTARTSPLETAAPSATFSAVDLAGAVGGDLVLHLHRLDHADQVALGDLGALLDGDFEDRALQRRGQRLARGARRRRRPCARASAACLPPAAGGGAPPADGLADHLDVEELAGDLDLVVAG